MAEELDPKSAKGQLITLLGKMQHEAEKVKVQIRDIEKKPELGEKINRICKSCIACGSCIVSP